MADQFEPYHNALAKFGLSPDCVPKAPPVYECPQCHGKNGRVREDHPDTGTGPRQLPTVDSFEAYVRTLISSYEEMASGVWDEYSIDEVERTIGKEALETLLNYDLDTSPDGGEPVELIVQQAKRYRASLGEADVLPREMGPCSTPMPRVKKPRRQPRRRTEDAVEDLVATLLEDDTVHVCVECAKKHPELVPPGAPLSHGLCRRHFIELYGRMAQDSFR